MKCVQCGKELEAGSLVIELKNHNHCHVECYAAFLLESTMIGIPYYNLDKKVRI